MQLREMRGKLKDFDICKIGASLGKIGGYLREEIFNQVIGEIFPKLKKDISHQSKTSFQIPNKINKDKPIPRHITI